MDLNLLIVIWLQQLYMCRGYDFAVMLNMSLLRKVQEPFIPMLYELVTNQTIDIPTINIHSFYLDIDPVQLRWTDIESVSIDTDPVHNSINIKTSGLDILIDRFMINAHTSVAGCSLSCHIHSTPNISNWTFEMAINVSPPDDLSQCDLQISINKSTIQITEGQTHFNWQTHSLFCTANLEMAVRVFEIESIIKTMLIHKIINFIDRQLPQLLNGMLSDINYWEINSENITWLGTSSDFMHFLNVSPTLDLELAMCFSDIKVNDDNVELGATFRLIDTEDFHTTTSTTLVSSTDDNGLMDIKEDVDDNMLLWALLISCVFSWICGCICCLCCTHCCKCSRTKGYRQNKERQWMAETSYIAMSEMTKNSSRRFSVLH